MNDPAAFLTRVAPGYDRLSDEEKEAIEDFTLLWSFYEGMILGTAGNADAIVHTVHSLKEHARLDLELFRPAIKYL